jgi:pimeloyl-[acyl-carrier protein] methyl ester esterase
VLREFRRSLAADRMSLLARFTASQARGDARSKAFAGLMEQLSKRNTPDTVLAEGLTVLAQADLRKKLGRIRQPTLVLHGAHDRIVPPSAGRRLAAQLDGRFALFRSCAHAPFLSQPARVAGMLRKFFDE